MTKDDDKTQGTETPPASTDSEVTEKADQSAPFERWLDRKLKTVYGSVLEEPIPDDIINLLRQKLDRKPE